MTVDLEWQCPLEVWWPCEHDVIGAKFESAILDFPITVHFPEDLPGRDASRMLRQPKALLCNTPTSVDWGIAHENPRVAGILRFGVTGQFETEKNSLDFGQFIIDAFDEWFDTTIDWLAVLTGTLVKRIGYKAPSTYENRTLMFERHPNQDSPIDYVPVFRKFDRSGALTGEQANQKVIQYCFDRSASKTQVPLAWSLLSEARALHREGHDRRAVVDSGSAAEMAAYTLLQRELDAKTTPGITKYLLNGTGNLTLGKLKDLLTAAGVTLPADFHSRLITPRNQVLHSNKGQGPKTPTEQESADAITAANEIVRTAYPLPPGAPLLW